MPSSTRSAPATCSLPSSSVPKPERVDTVIDFAAAQKYGVKTDGNSVAANREVVAELARLVANGRLEVPIARTYPLSEVQAAFRELEERHTLGKIVLRPD